MKTTAHGKTIEALTAAQTTALEAAKAANKKAGQASQAAKGALTEEYKSAARKAQELAAKAAVTSDELHQALVRREIMLAKKRAGMAALRARRKLEAAEVQTAAALAADTESAAAEANKANKRATEAAWAAEKRKQDAEERIARVKREAAELKAAAQRENEYRKREAAMLAAQYLEAQTAQRNFEAHTVAPALDLSAALAAVRTWFAYSAFGKLLLAALCNQYNRRHWLQQALADGDWQRVRLCTMGGSELDVLTFELSITKCKFNAHLCRRRIAGLLELAESESAAVNRHSLSAGTAF